MTGVVTAGFWRRFSAFVLDCMVGAGAWVFCSMWLVIGLWAFDSAPGDLFDVLLILFVLPGLALALHIAYRGEHPLFFYGQEYMGPLEAYIGALLFHIFGVSLFRRASWQGVSDFWR